VGNIVHHPSHGGVYFVSRKIVKMITIYGSDFFKKPKGMYIPWLELRGNASVLNGFYGATAHKDSVRFLFDLYPYKCTLIIQDGEKRAGYVLKKFDNNAVKSCVCL